MANQERDTTTAAQDRNKAPRQLLKLIDCEGRGVECSLVSEKSSIDYAIGNERQTRFSKNSARTELHELPGGIKGKLVCLVTPGYRETVSTAWKHGWNISCCFVHPTTLRTLERPAFTRASHRSAVLSYTILQYHVPPQLLIKLEAISTSHNLTLLNCCLQENLILHPSLLGLSS